jgi:hypothetical protein
MSAPLRCALRHAVRLDSEQPEPHYGLGLVYERRNMLTEAEQEMLTTLRLDPSDWMPATCWASSTPGKERKPKPPRSGVRCFGRRPATVRPVRTWRSSKANWSMVTLGVSHVRLRSRFAET